MHVHSLCGWGVGGVGVLARRGRVKNGILCLEMLNASWFGAIAMLDTAIAMIRPDKPCWVNEHSHKDSLVHSDSLRNQQKRDFRCLLASPPPPPPPLSPPPVPHPASLSTAECIYIYIRNLFVNLLLTVRSSHLQMKSCTDVQRCGVAGLPNKYIPVWQGRVCIANVALVFLCHALRYFFIIFLLTFAACLISFGCTLKCLVFDMVGGKYFCSLNLIETTKGVN